MRGGGCLNLIAEGEKTQNYLIRQLTKESEVAGDPVTTLFKSNKHT